MPKKPCDLTNAKIYRIVSFSTGKQYIGSTCDSLSRRMSGHKSNYKQYQKGNAGYSTSYEVLGHGDAIIYLIETPECKTLDELHKREGEVIQTTECVNKVIAGGSQKCEHNRQRNMCKDCGGSQICPHGKQKSVCKECGGSQICPHGKLKNQCKDCGGSQICEHRIMKAKCKDCGGSSICQHNKQRAVCKDCGGSQICPHDKLKNQCKDCGGSRICQHDKQRNQCKDCGGSTICEHGKQKNGCKDCGGKQTKMTICECGHIITYGGLSKHKKTEHHRIMMMI
jgi:hypothetical protein